MKAAISFKINALLLLCQLPLLIFSQTQNQKNGDRSSDLNASTGDGKDTKRPLNKHPQGPKSVFENDVVHDNVDRALVDFFDSYFSATSEDTNFTIYADDDDAEIQKATIDEADESLDNLNDASTSAEGIENDTMTAVVVTSTIKLELVETPSIMSNEQLQSFLDVTREFLSFHLFKRNTITPLVENKGIDVVLIQQSRAMNRRFLQQKKDNSTLPLDVIFDVIAFVEEESFISNYTLLNDGFDFDLVIRKVFVEKEEEYVEELKFTDGIYFSSLVNANLIEDHEQTDENHVYSSEEEVKESVNTPSKDDQESPDTNIFPSPWSDKDIPDTNGGSKVQVGGVLSRRAMVGIIISILTLLVAVAILIYFNCFRRNRSNAGVEKSNKKLWNRMDRLTGPVDSVEENLIERQHALSDKMGEFPSKDDVESQAMYCYNQSHVGSGSVNTDASPVKVHSSNSHSMSYAYRQEPGIEPTVTGNVVSNDRTVSSDQETQNDIPIQDISQVSMPINAKKDDVGCSKTTTEKQDHITSDNFGSTQIETALGELKLTKSELEILSSNLRSSGDDESESNENVGSTDRTRTVLAPAGKLGIIIDTTIDGPVVHNVKNGSPLSGNIFPGDIIVAIDGVDTRAMSASDITAIMVKTANQNRILTVRMPS